MSRTSAIVRATLIVLALLSLLVWFMWRRLKKSSDPARLVFKWVLTLGVLIAAALTIDFMASTGEGQIGGLLQALVYGVILTILWAGNLADILAKRVGALYDGGDVAAEPHPLYSVAEARRKQGKYQEAIYEIQSQLAQFPHDVTGQLMMAEIQAKHLADLPGAQLTVERFCHQPGHPPQHIASALNLLADLHLEHGRDPDAARQAFEKIIERLPDTPEAQLAAQRIAHLRSAEDLAAAHDRAPLKLKAGLRDLGLRWGTPTAAKADFSPEVLVGQYVNQLEQYPQDAEAREKLAVLYADFYQRLDLAAEQLEQLIHQPNQPMKLVVQWLNLLADRQVKHGVELETVQQTLQRIIDLNPTAAPAENARQRLALLKLEYKKNEKSQTLKLGAYERDLGLKHGPPREPPGRA